MRILLFASAKRGEAEARPKRRVEATTASIVTLGTVISSVDGWVVVERRGGESCAGLGILALLPEASVGDVASRRVSRGG